MANTIKQKRGTTDPGASDLVVGELAINTTDGGVFTKTDGGTVVEVGGSGGATDIDGLSDAITNSSGATIGLGTSALANDDGTTNKNTAVGYQSLNANTSGYENTATGYRALASNTTAFSNTANGANALYSNTTGKWSTANGANALFSSTTGSYNTSTGYDSLYTNTTGLSNTANGYQALKFNSTGNQNTATGVRALYNTTGSGNTAYGYLAGDNITSGSNNLVLGNGADASSATVSNEITLGNSSITSFRIPGVQSGASNGQVLTYNSTNGDLELADVSATVASGAIYENSQSITASYTITTNKNAMSAGPIDIASGATVTVPSGSVWTIV